MICWPLPWLGISPSPAPERKEPGIPALCPTSTGALRRGFHVVNPVNPARHGHPVGMVHFRPAQLATCRDLFGVPLLAMVYIWVYHMIQWSTMGYYQYDALRGSGSRSRSLIDEHHGAFCLHRAGWVWKNHPTTDGSQWPGSTTVRLPLFMNNHGKRKPWTSMICGEIADLNLTCCITSLDYIAKESVEQRKSIYIKTKFQAPFAWQHLLYYTP